MTLLRKLPSPPPRFFIPPRIALTVLALGASAVLGRPTLQAADVEVSASVNSSDDYRLFYDKLANDGDWYQTDQYGYVFRPKSAEDRTWRPYTDGYWAQTNAGWTWVSNESHGWATYHYGRWANIVDTGWVWAPGAEWSPGYVSWRVSKDHKRVGWAPLPPEARVDRDQGIEGWADTAYDIGPEAYVFIDTNHFGEDSYRSDLIPVEQNVTIINETENVTRVSYREVDSRSIVYNGGPDVAIIRESSGRPVREFQLETRPERVDYFQREDARSYHSVQGNRLTFAVAAPDVIRSTSIRVNQPARVSQRLSKVSVDRGYRNIGDAQAVERVRNTMRTQGAPPPPKVEQAASAAIRRNGAAVPLPNDRRPGQAAAPAPANDSTRPAATPAEAAQPTPPAAADIARRRGQDNPPAPGAPGVSPAPAEAAEGAPAKGQGRHLNKQRPGNGQAATPAPAGAESLEVAPAKGQGRHQGKPPGQEAAPAPAGVESPEDAPAKGQGRHRGKPPGGEAAAPAPEARSEQGNAPAEGSNPAAANHEGGPRKPKTNAPTPRAESDAAAPQPAAPRQSERAKPEQAQPQGEPQPVARPAAKAPGEGRGEHRAKQPAAGGSGAPEKEKPSPKPE